MVYVIFLASTAVHFYFYYLMTINTFDAYSRLSSIQINRLVNFLHDHQDQGKLSRNSIRSAIQYAAKERPGFGGYIFCLEEEEKLLGALVINKTGMYDYVPENLLVTIVVHSQIKDTGLEEKLLDYAINYCRGEIGVFINKSNAKEKTLKAHGFEPNYLEMRLKQ
ncbi:hypothetical protein [Croceivirga sp. JEA036]|uniref:hypothetical protein n=1 Tax=Croceivirga sp. JEA036 TaxID=2721162 RepID=UPI001439B09B|nr:hypothetical protein [Croceivirga sp. JEA036]NJB37957.1 hypothetical protein [Croceivirga sp. JEA036]